MADFIDLTRPWEIWLVHHTHVDIGYTEPQDVILRKHAEFVAQALDYCTATDPLPPGERFCWTCEVAWTIKAFLKRYPERSAEFFHRVREGRIEVTALYLQLTDLYTLELLEQTTDYAFDLARAHDFEIVTAMNDDVNGWTWGLPDLLSRRGVRNMDTAINETRSLGVRPRPAMFRWTGPQGGSVLFWHSDGYLRGNSLDLAGTNGAARVAAYLKRLEDAGYPHHIIEVRIHGENHDNAPPGLWLSETVRRWNAKARARQGMPTLRLVTPRAWFSEVATRWPAPLSEHRAGWPDWWADGNGTAAAESALVRQAQADMKTLAALTQATGQPAPADRLERARDAAAFFCEHTWGAWCSTDDPASLTSRAQWNTKSGYAYTAAVEAGSLVQDMLSAEATRGGYAQSGPGILVFNPSDKLRTDLVDVLIADADVGLPAPAWIPAPIRTEDGPAFHLVAGASGQEIPVLRKPAIADSARRPAQKVRFMALDVPAYGFRYYSIASGEIPLQVAALAHTDGLESPTVKIVLSPDGAGIATIQSRDRLTGASRDWVQQGSYALGEVIYETIAGPYGREKLATWTGIKHDAPLTRARIRFADAQPFALPYGAGLRLTAQDVPGSLRSLILEVVVYDALPRVDLCYRLVKNTETEAEGLYVAFPLTGGESPEVWLDLPGALMRPGIDQAPGTATDWHSIQHGFAVTGAGGAGADSGVAVLSPDIPLVQINGINTGKWQEAMPRANGLVMSWIMNNYWFTNFPAAQSTTLTWRYSLQALPKGQTSITYSADQPFAAVVVKKTQDVRLLGEV